MRLPLQKHQRQLYAEKIMDLANILAGAVLFGKLLSTPVTTISFLLLLTVGVVVWLTLFFASYFLSKG